MAAVCSFFIPWGKRGRAYNLNIFLKSNPQSPAEAPNTTREGAYAPRKSAQETWSRRATRPMRYSRRTGSGSFSRRELKNPLTMSRLAASRGMPRAWR